MRRTLSLSFLSLLISFFISYNAMAQCCAGGSGSPIAGGASQGVLQERQVELNTNMQFIFTDKFYSKDKPDTARAFDSFRSTYQYFRLAYGVSKNLTLSIESGYYLQKKEVGYQNNPATTYVTKGIGDLIIFPRYDVINWTEEKHRTEVTIGLGTKIPLGSYNDSALAGYSYIGKPVYYTMPTSVQPSSGAQDFIFYAFLFRGYTEKNFRLFANAMYIRKGWNPGGEKMGDYASVAVFAGKSFFNHLGVTLQARYEFVDTMRINADVFTFGKPSTLYPEATGYKKVFIVPQVSYTSGKFTLYALTEFPIYQYINSEPRYVQAGSKNLTTVGLSFRFFAVRSVVKDPNGTAEYFCPMHPDVTSSRSGNCPKCGMNLEKKVK